MGDINSSSTTADDHRENYADTKKDIEICAESDKNQFSAENIILYKRRWIMLFIFSLNCVGNAINFSSIAAINDIACVYYQVSTETLNWIPNSFLLIFSVICLPSAYVISMVGLRPSLIIGSSLNAATCCLHFAGSNRDGFYFVMAGNVCAAIALGAVLQVPAKLATVWFGADEHATATAVGYLVNILGMAIGFIQSTQMVPDKRDDMAAVGAGMFFMNLSQMVYVIVTLTLTYMFFKDEPPTPPIHINSSAQKDDELVLSFRESLRLLLRNRDFNLYAQAYGIILGTFCSMSTILDEMVCRKIPETDVGWMGFASSILGIAGMLGCGIAVDKYKCYKIVSVFLVIGGMVIWICFTIVFLFTDLITVMFVLYAMFGFFTIPLQSVGVEQVSVTTFPVPEEISAGLMLLLGNLYGFAMVLCFGAWIENGRSEIVCYVIVGLLVLASVCVCWSKVVVRKIHPSQERLKGAATNDA